MRRRRSGERGSCYEDASTQATLNRYAETLNSHFPSDAALPFNEKRTLIRLSRLSNALR